MSMDRQEADDRAEMVTRAATRLRDAVKHLFALEDERLKSLVILARGSAGSTVEVAHGCSCPACQALAVMQVIEAMNQGDDEAAQGADHAVRPH